jgi:hypothetical protein
MSLHQHAFDNPSEYTINTPSQLLYVPILRALFSNEVSLEFKLNYDPNLPYNEYYGPMPPNYSKDDFYKSNQYQNLYHILYHCIYNKYFINDSVSHNYYNVAMMTDEQVKNDKALNDFHEDILF